MPMEIVLLWVAVLMFASVVSSKISDKFAIPVLLLFLGIGILAGSEGIGKIYFANPQLAKSIGVIALVFIIFSGGLDTRWEDIKPVLWPGVLLSTVGVLFTAILTGYFAVVVLGFSLLEGLLLGSIVSSTDAAAVFTILRSRRLGLKKPLKPLLEFESGSNDPMAVFLTVSLIRFLTAERIPFLLLIPAFILDMSVGALIGYAMARLVVFLINRLELEYQGLYPVIMISLVLFTYAVTMFFKGNGFLAVYVLGLMLSRAHFPNKKLIMKFHDGLAWLMQIAMFVTLGLLVFPSHVVPLTGQALLLTLLLMFVARPLSVALCLLPFKMSLRKKAMIAWVGLRGSVPIILATFPYMAGIAQADTIFNVVLFVVIASVFIQGSSIPFISKALKLDVPWTRKVHYPLEFEKTHAVDAELVDVLVPYHSQVSGKRIVELGVPEQCLIVLISRDGKFVIPSGSTVIDSGDVLLVLASAKDLIALQKIVLPLKEKT